MKDFRELYEERIADYKKMLLEEKVIQQVDFDCLESEARKALLLGGIDPVLARDLDELDVFDLF